MPFLDNVFNTIAVWCQKIQGKMAVTITDDSVKAAKLKRSLQDNEKTRAIGFTILNEEEEEECEDDE